MSSSWRKNTTLVVEVIGLVALVLYTIFSILQWAQIRWTNRLTREALDGSNNTLQQTLQKMQGQTDATNRLYVEAQNQTRQATILANNSGKQADAAQRAAKTAREALQASVQESHADQRAWVGIAEAKSINYITDPSTGTATLTVAFTMRNYGRSTAEHVRFDAVLESDPLASSAPCDDVAKDRMGDILLPTQERTLNFVMPLTRAKMESGWKHQNTALGDMLVLKVFGCLDYTDRDGEKPPHRTPFSYLVFWKNAYITGGTQSIPGDQLVLDPYGLDSNQTR